MVSEVVMAMMGEVVMVSEVVMAMMGEVVMVMLAVNLEAMVWVGGMAMMAEVMVLVGAVAVVEVPCASSMPRWTQ